MSDNSMYGARVILDSIGPNGARLTTLEVTHPRMVHADFMTHRMFSRNASSSRAIPVDALLEKIERAPVMPVWWGKNQSGMQAASELEGDALEEAKRLWIEGRDYNVSLARRFKRIGLHKQLANRVVEPWMFITCVLTVTEIDNYFGLRIDAGAQPELDFPAKCARDALAASQPRELRSGEWHLPYVTGYDEAELRARGFGDDRLRSVAVGRCAAVSYLKQDSSQEAVDDERRAMERLYPSGHWSPFEHIAQAMTTDEWRIYGAKLSRRWVEERVPVGNFWGWRQWRKELDDEHNFKRLTEKRKARTA